LIVRQKDKKYEIVCGERRYRAAHLAELSLLPCNVRKLSDELQLNISNGEYKAQIALKNFRGPGTYRIGAGDAVIYKGSRPMYRSKGANAGTVVISQINKELVQGSLDLTAYSERNSQQFDLKVKDMKVDAQPSEF